MATIAQILPRFWAGAEWSIDGDNYGTLAWAAGNSLTKPTESEIRAHSAEVDVLISGEQQRYRQQAAMNDTPDYMLRVIETLIDGMIEIRRVVNDARSTAVAAAHTGSYTAWDSTVVSKLTALKQKVTDLRNVP